MMTAMLEQAVTNRETRTALSGWRLRNELLKAKHDVSKEKRDERGRWTDGNSWLPPGGMEEPPTKKVSPLEAGPHIVRQRLPDINTTVTLKNGETRERAIPQFRYFDSETHKEITNKDKLAIYRKLIPPGGTHGVVNPDQTGYHRATWTNKNDLVQYAYQKAHTRDAAAEKFSRLKDFNKALPKMRKQTLIDLDSDNPKIAQAALVTYIIDKTGFRLGGEASERRLQHYGASSLLNKHVKIDGDKVIFDFVGKEGVQQRKIVHDALMAKHLSRYKTSQWSQPLFSISSARVGAYVKQIGGDDFSPKDYRTWNGTYAALKQIAKRKGPAPDIKTFKQWQKQVATHVAEKILGNKPSEALNTYIDHHVWQKWAPPDMPAWVPKSHKEVDE